MQTPCAIRIALQLWAGLPDDVGLRDPKTLNPKPETLKPIGRFRA